MEKVLAFVLENGITVNQIQWDLQIAGLPFGMPNRSIEEAISDYMEGFNLDAKEAIEALQEVFC